MKKKVLVFAGLKDMGFVEGEEIKILKGLDFLEEPTRCIILKEYPEYLWIEVDYEDNSSGRNTNLRNYCTGINKKAMLCGDVVIRRAGSDVDLIGEEVGIVGLMIRKVKSDMVLIDEPGIDEAFTKKRIPR